MALGCSKFNKELATLLYRMVILHSSFFNSKEIDNMAKTRQEKSSQQGKQFLVFSTRLRHDIKLAGKQLDAGHGQEDITIDKEVEGWLNK